MQNAVKKRNTLTTVVIVLLLLVLLPTAFYSVYEFSSLNASEQMLGEMYNRQLDAILYSVNEYAWSVVNNWASVVVRAYEKSGRDDAALQQELHDFLRRNTELRLVALADSSLQEIRTFANGDSTWRRPEIESMLAANREKLVRATRYASSGYRKLEPLYPEGGTGIALVFAFDSGFRERYGIMLLNEQQFIRNVLGTKLRDVADTSFVLGVEAVPAGNLIYSTSPTTAAELRQQKALWLLPGYELGIRLKGTTVDELARTRTKRNLLFIGLLDVVLLAGAWFVYRSIRREMEFVRLKSDFVSNVSHELRTPLALIRMYAETLEMGRLREDEKKREYYSTIVKESERLTRLVNNILDFSRMEAGKKKYNFRETDVNASVADVMSTYSYHLRSAGITPVVRLASGLPGVYADPEAMMESVINLVDNAVKYGGEARFLRVETMVKDGQVGIEVEDHGIGIAAEHHSKIFDTFYRVSSGLVHETKGSGLGLSLVRHIMHAHGGTIGVESEPGKGSIFRLNFPIQQRQEHK